MAGRKRKPGKRTKSGQLSRAGASKFDRGTDHAQAMQSLYGTNGTDAIGRAFERGLLGKGQEAKAMLDMARRLSNAYWAAFETGSYKCPLNVRPRGGGVVAPDSAHAKRREKWLNDCLAFVRGMGEDVRKPFYQLVIDVHPDSGPDWVDRLCWAARTEVLADKRDTDRLRAALDALELLST